MDLLRHLEYFLAVVDEGTFSRAAERLGMAQPPLSQRIKTLEAHLGCDLFDRSRRQIRLTPAGSLLVPEARMIVQAAADLPAILTGGGSGPEPLLLDLPDTLAPDMLAGLAAAVAHAVGVHVLPRALPARFRGTSDDQHPVLVPGPGRHAVHLPLGLALPATHPLATGGLTPHPSDFCEARVLVLQEDAWQQDRLVAVLGAHGLDARAVHLGTDASTAVPQVHLEDAALLTDPVHAATHHLRWYELADLSRTWHADGLHADVVAACVARGLEASQAGVRRG